MINKVLVRIMYALIFGGMVAYIAQGLFHDSWVSTAFGVVTVAICTAWNATRARTRHRTLGAVGRFLTTRAGLAVGLAVLAVAGGICWLGFGDCPTTDASGKCGMPSHMNW
jgi:uncharacterized membrane protein